MNYSETFDDFYLKYYDKTEDLIKLFLLKSKRKNMAFGYALNEVKIYLNENYNSTKIFSGNSNLITLHEIFLQRHSIYQINEVQEIFANSILKKFREIPKTELPEGYTYNKFIKNIALVEVSNEIMRLLTHNSALLQMFYSLNNFEEFEIRCCDNLLVEQYPLYQKMNLALNPKYFENLRKNKSSESEIQETKVTEVEQGEDLSVCAEPLPNLKRDSYLNYNPNEWNEKCFELFNYLIDNYTAKNGKIIKFINIWYFLRKEVDKKNYTFTYTQEKFTALIQEKFNITIKKFAKAEYDFDEQKSILHSLEDQFRRL